MFLIILYFQKVQRRLLNSSKIKDYFFIFIISLIPIIFSKIISAWEITDIPGISEEQLKFTGYKNAFNQISLILILPLSLFLIRTVADFFFGISVDADHRHKVPILTFFEEDSNIQNEVHRILKDTALNPIISCVVFFLDIVFHIFDIGGVLKQYFLGFLGIQVNNNNIEIYYANLYLVRDDINIIINFLFAFSVYLSQFIIFYIGITAILLVLFYNIFYLSRIYQRSRVNESQIKSYIVVDFDDPEHRFGLGKANGVFNLQLILLVFAGFSVLCSRWIITKRQSFFILENFNLTEVFLKRNINNFFAEIFPEFGQYIIVLSWLFAFFVVLLPSFIKFLPFFSCDVIKTGWSITKYLKEFITPTDQNDKYPLNDIDQVNKVAYLFANNSFWPSGDDIARFIFIFVFFTCFIILFPLNQISIFIFIVIGILLSETFLNIYKWVLGHVDKRLVNKEGIIVQNIHNRGTQVMGDVFSNIGKGATIVNKSIVDKSFNKILEEFDEDTANALKRVEEEINKSGNQEAAELFKSFNEELQKDQPKKLVLRTFWEGIERILPTITQLTKVVENITKLFI